MQDWITAIALYAFGGLVLLAMYLFPPTEHAQETNAEMLKYFTGRRVWMWFLIFIACVCWPVVLACCWADELNKFEWYE